MKNSSVTRFIAATLLSGGLTFVQAGAQIQELPPVGSQDGPAPKATATPQPVTQPVLGTGEMPEAMDIRDSASADALHIMVGHSLVLNGVSPLRRIYIGNPAVLQSFTAGPSEIVLTAKIAGVSSLVLWDTEGKSKLYTVSADVDPTELRRSLRLAFPKSHLDVQGREGRVYLTGDVPTPEAAESAIKMASSFSTGVVNSLRVVTVHGKQVQLKLRIVEVDRSKLEQFGINIAGTPLSAPFSTTTGQFPSTTSAATASTTTGASGSTTATSVMTDALNLFLYSTKLNFGATVKALEQKQVLQILAEPTLTSISGQPAKFLAGGEFPFPIVQGGAAGSAPTITISFRPYGVRLDFLPVVNEDGTIRLKIAPEVSTLDFSNAVTISGFVVPALATKRAETDIEIKDGQSFALSGLLDHRTTESLSQVPGISRIPILGKLFVSKSYSHSVVELVVLVTATVVDPLHDATPTTEPAMAVPNLESNAFDEDIAKQQKIPAKKP